MFRKIFLILVAVLFILVMSRLSFAMNCGSAAEEHSVHRQMAQSKSEPSEKSVKVATETDMQSLPTEPTDQSVATKAIEVGNKICPVSGEVISEETKATYEYEGKIYNFCCPMCIDAFKKDPEKYIKKVEEELQDKAKEQSKHTEHEMETMQEPETMHQGMHEGHHH